MIINIGTLEVSADLPVGGTIFKQESRYDDLIPHNQAVKCGDDGHFAFDFVTNMSGSESNISNTYDTNLSGIGIRVSMYSNQDYYSMPTSPTFVPFTRNVVLTDSNVNAAFGTAYLQVVIELIKTAASVSSGNLTYNVPDFTYAQGTNQLILATLNLNAAIVSSCSVDSATHGTVSLDTAYSSDFGGVGSTAKEKPFNIVLSCDGSSEANITFTADEDTDAPDAGVIKNDATNGAAGVGVQLLYHDSPVTFDSAFSVGATSAGTFTIPLAARYYKTRDKISSGDVHAVATYTLTYQ